MFNLAEMVLGLFFLRSPYLGVPLVIGSEAFVMWRLGWGTGQRCLVDALIMNSLGIFPAWAGMWIVALASGRILHRFPSDEVAVLLFGLFAIPAEAWLLSLTKRHPFPKMWRTAVYANITSFCLIVGLTILSYAYTRLFSS